MTPDAIRTLFFEYFPIEPAFQGNVSEVYPDLTKINTCFEGKLWAEVLEDDIDNCVDALPLFEDEAFHYFLPAFLLRAMRPDDECDVMFFTWQAIKCVAEGWSLNSDGPPRISYFTAEQKAAVLSYCRWANENENGEYDKDLAVIELGWRE